MRTWKLIPGLATAAVLMTIVISTHAAVAADGAANVNAKRMMDPAATAANWMSYGGTYSEQHYSTLTQINKDNVAKLGLAWFADYDTNLTQAGTPLEIDGVIYVSTAWTRCTRSMPAPARRCGNTTRRLLASGSAMSAAASSIAVSRPGTARSISARWMAGWLLSTRRPAR